MVAVVEFARLYYNQHCPEILYKNTPSGKFIYICSLFNDAFSVNQTIQRRMKCWKVNDELGRILKEVDMA
jgi:hypothetical protein